MLSAILISLSLAFQAAADYQLGPDDQIRIWALGMEEISDQPVRIDAGGYIDVPMLGRLRAAGFTTEQLSAQLLERLAGEVRQPRVSITIVEFGSQPVSVIGAVGTPGVHQLQGRKTLLEVLARAGGLRPDAGPRVHITRALAWGPVPAGNVRTDASGRFSVAEIQVKGLLAARNPADNIQIRPHDVISVPKADLLYVMGAVRKPGAFVLDERESVSLLQALSMAEGLGSTPAPRKARILRLSDGSTPRREIPVDVARVLDGKAADPLLRANDILFIPTSSGKKAALRTLEAVIQTGTGMAIWRR